MASRCFVRYAMNISRISVKDYGREASCSKYPRLAWKRSTSHEIHTSTIKFAAAAKPKQQKVKRKEVKKLKNPVDDVYLQDLYEPTVYQLEAAVSTLRRYMELDLADNSSPVVLNLSLHLAPKGRGKFQSFWHIEEPVHNFTHTNKVCVFTEDADEIKTCIENGAFLTGGHDAIQKLIFAKEICDAYVSTQEFKKTVLDKNVELVKIMGKLAPSKKKGLTVDVVSEMMRLRDGLLIHNQSPENTKCCVVVGLIEQPVDHIVDNIVQTMNVVRTEQNPKHPPIIKEASVLCCEEALFFDVGNEEDD